MMNKKWFGVGAFVGLVLLASVLLVQTSDVWAGGAGIFAQLNPAKPESTDGLIIKLRDKQISRAMSLTATQVNSLSAMAGIGLTHFRAMSGDAQVFKLPQPMPLAEVEAIARRLSADPQVEYAEPDRIMRPLLVPNDAQYINQWHYKSHLAPDNVAGGANLPGAWDITTGSVSIVVAVIDTGLRPHADIDSNITDGIGKVATGYDFITNTFVANDGNGRDNDPTDPGDWIATGECGNPGGLIPSSWHGTHVAGTIGALGNNTMGVAGINWVSRILPVRVLGKCGGSLSDVVDGMRWAAGLAVTGVPANPTPAKVLNLSLGGDGTCSITEQTAIDAIVATGAVIVVAAGNSTVDLAVTPESPANCNSVISVAAVNRNGGRADYSNFGTTVEIAAPGGERAVANDPNGVLSTLNSGTTTPAADNYIYYAGTSMAAPHVAGIVSLMLSANPALTPAQVLATLQSTARAFPVGTGGIDCTVTTCGAGIINASAAVAAVAVGVLSPSPTSVNFGGIEVGQAAPAQTVTFTNTDNDSLTLSATNAVSLGGTNAADFSVTGGTCATSLSLAQGANCTVVLGFTPGAAGVRSANLVITSTATNSPLSVPLSGTGTLPTISVSATDASAAETVLTLPANPGTFTITRSVVTTPPVTVTYSMSGTATSGTDYTAPSGSASFSSGATSATVTIAPIDDVLFEGNETVVLTLNAGTGYTVGSPASATVTLADDEPTVSVSATDATAAETVLTVPVNPGTFTITRAGIITAPVTVNYAMSGTATNGTDYMALSGSVNINGGVSVATVTITPIDDSVFEGSQTAVLTLTAGTGYGVVAPASATVTIADNDLAPPQAPSGPKGGCFIATAAYGTPMANDVRHLRAFRDEYLQTNEAGRWFVSQYYKFSPPFADYLRQHDDLRAVVRTALGPLVGLSKAVVSGDALAAQTAERP